MWSTQLFIHLDSNEEKRYFTIAFTDSQNNNRKYAVKFWNKGTGNVGTITLIHAKTNLKWRNLFRYSDYKQSKFEKENRLINFWGIKLFKNGYTDPYEGKRPVPFDRSFKIKHKDLNRIGVGKVRIKLYKTSFTLYL